MDNPVSVLSCHDKKPTKFYWIWVLAQEYISHQDLWLDNMQNHL